MDRLAAVTAVTTAPHRGAEPVELAVAVLDERCIPVDHLTRVVVPSPGAMAEWMSDAPAMAWAADNGLLADVRAAAAGPSPASFCAAHVDAEVCAWLDGQHLRLLAPVGTGLRHTLDVLSTSMPGLSARLVDDQAIDLDAVIRLAHLGTGPARRAPLRAWWQVLRDVDLLHRHMPNPTC